LIFTGISLEVCAAFPAITAVGKGLDACVAVDTSGTFSENKRQVGVIRSDYAAGGRSRLRRHGHAWAKLVGQIAQAYGK
jgi:hypothetical protein